MLQWGVREILQASALRKRCNLLEPGVRDGSVLKGADCGIGAGRAGAAEGSAAQGSAKEGCRANVGEPCKRLKEVEEEEEEEEVQPLERRRTWEVGQSSGDDLEKKIFEWVANLSVGEAEEVAMYIPKAEQEAAMEWDAEEDSLKRGNGGQEEDGVALQNVTGEEEEDRRGQRSPTGGGRDPKEDQYEFSRGQDMTVRAMRLGFRDFARELVGAVGAEVKHRLEKTERFSVGAIEGTKIAAPKEEETRPRREPVKVKFPDSYSGKKEENFDNWEANVKSCVHLRKVSSDEQVLIAIHALKDDAANFARSLVRAANCNEDPVAYSAFTPLAEFLKLLRERFADVSRSVKAADRLQTIHSRQWKSARALKGVMDELVVVPDHGVTEPQLVKLFYRAMPESLRGHFFAKAQDPATTYDSLSREVVAFEANSVSVSTFWHKDLDKGKKWKGRTISGQIKTKDSLVLTLDEGSVDEIPYEQIEWGLEEEDSGASEGRTYAAAAAGGGPQGGGRGHVLDGDGVRPEDAKIVAIRDWPIPRTLTKLHSFLGLANYYRKFVRNFSTIAAPLRRLLKKEIIWKWDKDCTSDMKKLKQALIRFPVLKVVDPSLPFVVTTDASQYGIGAVLQQDDGNGYRPVEFMSARMPLEKVAASTYERELYALRQALDHWKHYLLGRHFKVYSDHETLSCKVCQRNKTTTHAPLVLRPLPIPDQPGDSVSIDFMDTGIKSRHGKSQVMVVVDRFSKDAIFVPLPFEARTKLVIQKFFDHWFSEHGIPLSIVSDRDTRFTSQNWQELMRVYGSKLLMSSGRHPETNGQAEQMNKILQEVLCMYIRPDQVNWDEMLPKVASAYNNSVHLSTNRTPNELHKSFRPRRPFEGLNRDQIHRLPPGTREFAIQQEKEMATIVDNIRKAQHRMIEQANKHRRPSQFQVGDLVWVKSKEFAPEENIPQKLLPAYRGPWPVLEVKGGEDGPSYTIEIPAHLHTYPVFHASKLLPCQTSDQFSSRRSMIPPDMDGRYDIDRIVAEDIFRTGDRGRPQKQYKAVPGPAAGASSSAPSSRQLEDRVDHVVAMLGDISTFAAPTTTISSQLHTLKTEVKKLQSTNADDNLKMYKMPTFNLERFDDYTHQDPVLWWEAFTTQLRILPVAKHAYIGALFLNSKGGCQTWLSHLATSHEVEVPDLKGVITWEELTRLWKKRFIVDDAPHLRREFYNRSCAALSQALGDREQYSTFAEIIDKAREIFKTNRSAAHEKSISWQPTYVEKVRTGPRQQHFAAVQQDSGDNPAATPASSDGDQVAAVQPRSTNKSRNNGKAKSASQAGNGQPGQFPWVKFGLTEAEYKVRGRYGSCYWCNNTKHKTSLCQDQGKEEVRPRLSSGN
ncbi:hypothetical protein CBR_g38198 [Chara braunii]|uniref:Integrase catalytic domain-containing protein n=1 Tax=Chara braunii TaxID=69332 RepID=A0A388LPF2_CHABU|nr:hypothetical protein CBR_g38198 [Chara braunii]|eukprot:GBG84226.1 hypothetical protein CBR_g38198 [Chara braunii]